jgi:ATP-dependent DNA helicase RecG
VLKRAGPRLAQTLKRLDITTLQDLLFHLPLRYQDRTRVTPMAQLRPGGEAVIEGEIIGNSVQYGRRRSLLVQLSDGGGVVQLRFFHFNGKQQAMLEPGARLRCYGEVRLYQRQLEMIHPEYQRLFDEQAPPAQAQYLTPIYPATEGVRQATLRALIEQLIEDDAHLKLKLTEWLPQTLLQRQQFPPLEQAVAYLHKPPPGAPLQKLEEGRHRAQQRLAFEELLAHHLSMRLLRRKQRRHAAPSLANENRPLSEALITRLPFDLTGAQRRVLEEIRKDLCTPHPMQRLLQGDVGSGKTVVAALAALQAVQCGYQVAVMAPTEILADQHRLSFQQWLQPLDISVGWLSGKVKGKAREVLLQAIAGGEAAVVVGTHALFQEEVQFNRLGLVIIDEQHRFGVHQRLALRNKGAKRQSDGERLYPHQLIMTATPIPRTLAMTAYADLDCSIIDELPPGRTPVETVIIANNRRGEVVERVHAACRAGRQTYWVCTLIEESEALQCQAAQDTAAQLAEEFPDLRIGLVHGRLKAAEKEQVMGAFKSGELDLLVATTVIEVGVDVPNATLMIIENAERLGLSQLHQLRGRVGRGSKKSVCVLMYQAPLSTTAKARLAIMRETNDGFKIARKDLELRGPGEVLGTRQTGGMQFRIADLQRDQHLLTKVGQSANLMLNDYPDHVAPLIRRWVGHGAQYGRV